MGRLLYGFIHTTTETGFTPPLCTEKNGEFSLRPYRGARKGSGRQIQQPGKDQDAQIDRLVFERFGENAQGALDMAFDRVERDVEAFGDLAVFQSLEPAEDEHLPAALRQRVDDPLNLALQFLVQIGMFILDERKIVIIEAFLPDLHLRAAVLRVPVNDIFMLQIIEASVAGSDEQQPAGIFRIEWNLLVPQRHKAVLHQILRHRVVVDKTSNVG